MNIEQGMSLTPMNAPVIAGIQIRTDDEGLYSLNDLHRASGGRDAKRPKTWLETKQAHELIQELRQNSALGQEVLKVMKGGTTPGTYAHELLAVSYAGWISPSFQLMVNQTFLDARSAKRPELTTTEILELALETAKERDALLLANSEQAEKISGLENLFKDGLTAPQLARMLNGVNVQKINAFLLESNWVFKERGRKGGYRVASYARDKYMTEKENVISPHGRESFVTATPVLLKKGAQKIYEWYLQGKLPMKQSWDGEYTHLKLASDMLIRAEVSNATRIHH